MKHCTILILVGLLSACGPSQKEKEEVAELTCNIIGSTRNMDAAYRLEKLNEARNELGIKRFLGSDEEIKQSLEFGLCKALVSDPDAYSEQLSVIQDRLFEEEEKRREQAKVAAEAARLREIERDKQRSAALIQYRAAAMEELYSSFSVTLNPSYEGDEALKVSLGLANLGKVSLNLAYDIQGVMGREIFCSICEYQLGIGSIKIDFVDPEIPDLYRLTNKSFTPNFAVGGSNNKRYYRTNMDVTVGQLLTSDEISKLKQKFGAYAGSIGIPTDAFTATIGIIYIETFSMEGEKYPFQCEYYPVFLNYVGNCNKDIKTFFEPIEIAVERGR